MQNAKCRTNNEVLGGPLPANDGLLHARLSRVHPFTIQNSRRFFAVCSHSCGAVSGLKLESVTATCVTLRSLLVGIFQTSMYIWSPC